MEFGRSIGGCRKGEFALCAGCKRSSLDSDKQLQFLALLECACVFFTPMNFKPQGRVQPSLAEE